MLLILVAGLTLTHCRAQPTIEINPLLYALPQTNLSVPLKVSESLKLIDIPGNITLVAQISLSGNLEDHQLEGIGIAHCAKYSSSSSFLDDQSIVLTLQPVLPTSVTDLELCLQSVSYFNFAGLPQPGNRTILFELRDRQNASIARKEVDIVVNKDALFQLLRGSCIVSGDGQCFSDGSGDGQNYGVNEQCDVVATRPTQLHVVEFDTETCCDYLTIDDLGYTADVDGIFVETGTVIQWKSDGSVTGPGFTICGQRNTTTNMTTRATTTPNITPLTTTAAPPTSSLANGSPHCDCIAVRANESVILPVLGAGTPLGASLVTGMGVLRLVEGPLIQFSPFGLYDHLQPGESEITRTIILVEEPSGEVSQEEVCVEVYAATGTLEARLACTTTTLTQTTTATPTTLVSTSSASQSPETTTNPIRTTTRAPVDLPDEPCQRPPTDIVFVIDSSGSVSPENFAIMINFTKYLSQDIFRPVNNESFYRY
jgi:hypothetical protein